MAASYVGTDGGGSGGSSGDHQLKAFVRALPVNASSGASDAASSSFSSGGVCGGGGGGGVGSFSFGGGGGGGGGAPSRSNGVMLGSKTKRFYALDPISCGIALNSTASLGQLTSTSSAGMASAPEQPGGVEEEEVVGSKTEGALLLMLKQWLHTDYALLRKQWGSAVASRRLFTSQTKFMSCLVLHVHPTNGKVEGGTVFCKGAAEVVLSRCNSVKREWGRRGDEGKVLYTHPHIFHLNLTSTF
jgi:hypothetical protein